MTDEVRASSWTELHELLYESSWNEPLGRFRNREPHRLKALPANDTAGMRRIVHGHLEFVL